MRKIVCVDMDGILADFESGIKSLSAEEYTLCENKLDEVPSIFSRMKPIKGALEAFEKLNKHFFLHFINCGLGISNCFK